VALNASGAATASQLLAPYGGSRYSSGTMPTDYGFTGQHADSTSGLDYYVSRYYDPVAGQFTSPDTVLPGNGYHIFGLSRYAYVEGNPETRNDPTGRCPFCLAVLGGIVAGAAIGAAISYGTQVVGNLQHGQSLGSALTHVDVAEIGKAALVGAVVGGTGALAASLLAGAGVGIGLSIAGSMAIGAGEGAMRQVGDNLLHGRAWHQGLAQAALIGAGTAGVGAVAWDCASWLGASRAP
jgi:RHS repeat-associated protein